MSTKCRKFCPSFGICRPGGIKTLAARGISLISIENGTGMEVLNRSEGTTAMTTESKEIKDDAKKHVTDLYWLAFLLTGRQDLSIEIASDSVTSAEDASPLFADWMRGWQRRLVIGRALTAIHDELADSAGRTQLARANGSAMPQRNWSLSPSTTKAELEKALLAIDPFPRAALLLLVFE